MKERVVLQWMPMFASALMASPRYRSMLDYQQAWYLNLLINSWLNSVNPGYLRNDDQMYVLANARTRPFFDKEKAVVMACFQTSSDALWVFNDKLLEVYEIQLKKYWGRKSRGTSLSVSDLVVDVEVKQSGGTDELTERIWRTHPSSWRAKGNLTRIPQAHMVAIMQAIIADGKELVEQGTQAYANAVSMWPKAARKFVMNPITFYGEGHYLHDAAIWERSNDRLSKAGEKRTRNDEIILDALRRRHGGNSDPADREHDREGTDESGIRLLAGVARKATAGSD